MAEIKENPKCKNCGREMELTSFGDDGEQYECPICHEQICFNGGNKDLGTSFDINE